MKIVASGDHHFDESSRFSECIRVHDWIADYVHADRPDVFLSGGDIFERASTPLERQAVADWLIRVAEICPVIIAKGNHDRRLDCAILSRLRTRHPIIVEERCGVHRVGDGAIAVVAYPSRASLAAMIGKPLPSAALDDVARDCLRDVLRGLGAELAAHDGPRVLLTHAMINGSITSTGQPLVGAEMNVGLDDLALAGADITIAAHIHKPQHWTHGGQDFTYTGSPFRTAFGETEEKSIVVAEVSRAGTSWRRVPTPAAGMELFDGAFTSGVLAITSEAHPTAERVRGAEVRLRYSVAAEDRDAGQRAAAELKDRMLADGAISVKVEDQVIAKVRARAPEVAAAKTLEEKLRALWAVRQLDIPEERARVLLGRVASLETAA